MWVRSTSSSDFSAEADFSYLYEPHELTLKARGDYAVNVGDTNSVEWSAGPSTDPSPTAVTWPMPTVTWNGCPPVGGNNACPHA